MKKSSLSKLVVVLVLISVLMAVGAVAMATGPINGARGDSTDNTVPVMDPEDITEGFEDITNLPGWFMQNNSSPLGLTNWFQGNDTVFPAQAGPATSYIGANYNNTSGVGTISNWLLTPVLSLNDGDEISFWTRTADGSIWPDRVQVRMSTNGASTNVGTLATDVGDFTAVLLEVNPNLQQGGYPEVWTEFSATVSGVGTTPVDGRIGFRYFVTNGGPSGSNSNYIGIDTLTFTDAQAPAAVTLSKTVGLDPDVCAITNSVNIPAGYGGTEVTYCYTAENTGGITLTYHTLEDDHLGTLLGPDFEYDLAPGASTFLTVTVNITQTTVNSATWSVRDAAGAPVASASDTATVNVNDPTSVNLSGLSGEKSGSYGFLWLGIVMVFIVGFGVATLRRKVA